MRNKIYVGKIKGSFDRELFRSTESPTEENFPKYAYVIGPFRTVRGANWCVTNRYSTCRTVAEYERVAAMLESNVIRAYENHAKVYG